MKFTSIEKNGIIKIQKSYEKISEENAELANELDYITKQEMIDAIKKIANHVGVEVCFTFDNLKNDI